MKTILLNAITAILLFLIPTVTFAQTNDLSTVPASTNVFSKAINVYPNPSNGNISMRLNSPGAANYDVSVIDMTGKTVFNNNYAAADGINIYSIDLSKVVKGIYLLSFGNGNEKEEKKIILQ